MPQVLEGITSVQESGFQLGKACECRLHAFGVNLTAGLLLQVFIAADVVCIGMGVDDGVQAPASLSLPLSIRHIREPSIRNTPILAGQLM